MEFTQEYDFNTELEEKAPGEVELPPVPRSEATQQTVGTLVAVNAASDPTVDDPAAEVTQATQQTKVGNLTQALEPAYRRALDKDRRTLEQAAKDAAASGDVQEFTRLVKAAVPTMSEYAGASDYMRAAKLAVSAAEYSATGKPAILANNTPEQIAAATEKVGQAIAGEIVLHEAIKDAKANIGVGSWAGSIAVAFTPFLTPIRDTAIKRVLEKYTGSPKGILDVAEALEDFRILYQTTPESKRGELMTSVIADLKNVGLASNIEIAGILDQMMSREHATERAVEDSLNALFGVVDVAGAAELARSGIAAMKHLRQSKKSLGEQTAKTSGSKAVGDIVGETIQTPGTNPLGMTHDAQVDAAISASLSRTLGESMSGASSAVQTKLIQKSEELISNIRSTLVASGKTSQEVSDALKNIHNTYNPAVNKSVYSVDVGRALSGDQELVVHYQSFAGKPYVTREAAEAAAAVRGGGFEIVPAKNNTEWLLKRNEIEQLQAKIKTLKESSEGTKPRLRWAEVFDGSPEANARLAELRQLKAVAPQVAFHGTAYKFKNFNFEKAVRTAVGWGAYFSMSKQVATAYAKASKNWKARKNLSLYSDETGWISGTYDDIWSDLAERNAAGTLDEARFKDLTAQLDLRLEQRRAAMEGKDSYIMSMNLPENDKLFDWDANFDSQTDVVKQAFKSLGITPASKTETAGSMYQRLANELGGQRQASQALHAKGVQGHLYDAGFDAPAGIRVDSDEKNFVIYDQSSVEFLARDFVELDEILASKSADPRDYIGMDDIKDAVEQNRIAKDAFLKKVNAAEAAPHVSPDILQDHEAFVDGIHNLLKKLGMSPKGLKIVSFDYLQKANSKEAIIFREFPDWYPSRAGGFYDPQLNMVAVNLRDSRSPANLMTTLLHEVGHHFIFTRVNESPEVQRKLVLEFNEFWKNVLPSGSFKTSSDEEIAAFMKMYRSVDDVFLESVKFYSDTDLAKYVRNLDMWYGHFHEFYAEQFTKWAVKSSVGANALAEGGFLGWLVKMMREFYTEAKKLFGGAGYVSPSFKEFMNEWVTSVEAKKESVGPYTFLGWENIDSTAMHEFHASRMWINHKLGGGAHAMHNIKTSVLADLESQLAKAKDVEESLAAGWLLRKKETVFDESTVTKFADDDINSIAYVAADPLHGTSKFLYEERLIGVHAEAKIKKALSDFVSEPFDKLSGKERVRVQNLLIEGDAYSNNGGVGKEFSAAELIARGYSDSEQEAYFAARAVRNIMHEIRDSRMAARLREQGYSKFTIAMKDGEDVYQFAGKRVAFNDYIGKRVWDSASNEAVTLTRAGIDSALSDGQILVSTADTLVTATGKEYNVFLVPANALKESSIQTVLPKRPGEFARIYTEPYFITTSVKRIINDEDVVDTFNVKTAASRHDAARYTEAMNKAVAMHKAGNLTVAELDKLVGKWEDSEKLFEKIQGGAWSEIPDNPFSFHYNRMEDDYIRDFTASAIEEGRLFTSKRGIKIDSISSLSDVGNTMDPMSALQAEITNVSRFTTISAWRDSAIQRWYNTFKDILPSELQNLTPEQAFFRMDKYKYTSDDQRGVAAQRVYNYVLRQIGTPTKEEEFFRGITKQLTDKFMPDNKLGTVVGGFLRNASPTRFLRTFSFHTMLGMFNPAQLLVQSVGAATAIAIHPIHGAAAAKTVPLLRVALMSDNEAVWRTVAAANKYGSLGLGSIDDFVDTVKAIRKSGIIDGINSTSLYNIEDGRFNVFSKTARRASEGSAFFFNRGEEFARLVGFDVARREWMKSNKGKDWRTDAALKEILVRQDSLTQNMTRANENLLQRGILSVPTQFLQYNIKLGMNLVGAFQTGAVNIKRRLAGEELRAYRGFTPTEAAQVLIANFILWGAAYNGIPDFAEEWIGEKAKDMTEEQRLYFTQGAVAGLLNTAMKQLHGEEMALATGKRFNALQWYEDVAKGMTALFTGKSEVNPAELMLGASYASLARMGAVGKQFYLWYKDPNLSPEDIADGIRFMATETVVTLKNADKMYLAWNTGYVFDPKGNKIATANKAEAIAQLLSVPPAEVADYYKSIEYRQKHFDRLRDIAKHYVDLQREWYRAENLKDFARAEEVRKAAQALIAGMPISDWTFVVNEAKNKVAPYDTALEKEVLEFNNRALLSPDSAKPLTTVR